jgi:hypothetical protein
MNDKRGDYCPSVCPLSFCPALIVFSSWIYLIALVMQEDITKYENIPRPWEPLVTLRQSDRGWLFFFLLCSISAKYGCNKMLKVKAMTSVAGKGPTENILSSAVHMQSIHHQASRS